MIPPARVIYSTIFFVLVMTLIVLTKPALFFSDDGKVRPFGFSSSSSCPVESTPVPLGLAVVLAAIGSMLLFGTIDVVYAAAAAPAPAAPVYAPQTMYQQQQQPMMHLA